MEFKTKQDDFEASINMIPLIDIMLVLLIIFMIAAPVLKYSFEVNTPEATSSTPTEQTEDTPIITITKDEKIRLNGIVISSLYELQNYLEKLKPKEILVEADKSVRYGFVISIMDVIKQQGIEKVGLVTQKKSEKYK